MEKIKAIIFDLDGTLVDSLTSIGRSMNHVLARLGYPEHPTGAYRYFVGDGIENLVTRSVPDDARKNIDIRELVRRYREQYDRIWPRETLPYPGIREMLDHLVQKQVKMAVLSNKFQPYTRKIVQKILPDWAFDSVHGARPGVPLKPDPSAALEICTNLEIPPEQTVFMGDTGIDMETGKRARMIPVGVLWGFREKDELLSHGARYIVTSPLDCIDIFK